MIKVACFVTLMSLSLAASQGMLWLSVAEAVRPILGT